jgi:hypothetical protein
MKNLVTQFAFPLLCICFFKTNKPAFSSHYQTSHQPEDSLKVSNGHRWCSTIHALNIYAFSRVLFGRQRSGGSPFKASLGKKWDPISKTKINTHTHIQWGWGGRVADGVAQGIEHLPSKSEALSSNSSTGKKIYAFDLHEKVVHQVQFTLIQFTQICFLSLTRKQTKFEKWCIEGQTETSARRNRILWGEYRFYKAKKANLNKRTIMLSLQIWTTGKGKKIPPCFWIALWTLNAIPC